MHTATSGAACSVHTHHSIVKIPFKCNSFCPFLCLSFTLSSLLSSSFCSSCSSLGSPLLGLFSAVHSCALGALLSPPFSCPLLLSPLASLPFPQRKTTLTVYNYSICINLLRPHAHTLKFVFNEKNSLHVFVFLRCMERWFPLHLYDIVRAVVFSKQRSGLQSMNMT